jgi:hypothetical protein
MRWFLPRNLSQHEELWLHPPTAQPLSPSHTPARMPSALDDSQGSCSPGQTLFADHCRCRHRTPPHDPRTQEHAFQPENQTRIVPRTSAPAPRRFFPKRSALRSIAKILRGRRSAGKGAAKLPLYSLWLSHVKSGVEVLKASQISEPFRKIESTAPDFFGANDGLVNDGDRALLRDRDGNIWIAGTKGLERFQNATLLPVLPKAKSGLWSVCAAPNGDVWLSLFGSFSGVVRNDHITRLKDELIGALACGKDGKVRVFGNRGIGEVRGDHVVYLPLLPGHGAYWARTQHLPGESRRT